MEEAQTLSVMSIFNSAHKKASHRDFQDISFRSFFSPQQEEKKGKSSQRRQTLKRVDHFRPLPFLFGLMMSVDESIERTVYGKYI